MYNHNLIKKGLETLSEYSTEQYNAVSDYVHDLEQENNRLLRDKHEALETISNRNKQIADLKHRLEEAEEEKNNLEDSYNRQAEELEYYRSKLEAR